MLERLFLYKSLHWLYEEEIRVARRVEYAPQVKHQDFTIPPSAIVEVFLGAKYFSALNECYDGKLPKVHLLYPEFSYRHC